jgi:RNA polymerase sigma-70 factor, ECF subfamily
MADSSAVPSSVEVTQLLRAWGQGDEAALARLVPLVEAELHRLAHRYMSREKPGHTLQTTALVNEVYLRLVDIAQVSWQDRAHFFAISARMMRRILTDFARSRNYQKYGGAAVHVTFDEALAVSEKQDAEIVAIDEALVALAAVDPRKSQVVELRFFGGLSVEETAEVLKISEKTVKRDWRFAKAWLHQVLSGEKDQDDAGAMAAS